MQKRIDRLIDEALLLAATQTSVLYLHRRGRRAFRKVALGTALLAGAGVAAATGAAAVGAAGLAGGALVWYRKSERSPSAVPIVEGTPASSMPEGRGMSERFRREPASETVDVAG
jgi:hypothetical protein